MRNHRLVLSALLCLVSACQSEKPTAPLTVSSVTLTSASGTLVYGQTVQLTASVVSTSGTVLSGRTLAWSSSNEAVASVSPTGLVTAGAVRGGNAETATITVASDGKLASTAITVTPIPAATVTLSLAQFSTYVGQATQLGVSAKDVTGGALTGRSATWSSSVPAIAAVSSQGIVTAITAGKATITATIEGKSATATVTVALVPVKTVSITPSTSRLNVGQTLQLTASARDSVGNALTGRAVTWTTTAPSVATVTSQGLVTAIAAGTAEMTATVEGTSTSATVTVALVAVNTVMITPASGSLYPGQTLQLAASAKDSAGNSLTGRAVTWRSLTPSIATISETGLVTGITPGTATITGTIEAKSASATLTVTRAIPAVNVGAWTMLGPQLIPWWNGKSASGKLQAFAAAQSDPRVMYVAGGPDRAGPYTQAGIFKTINGGQTWTQVGAPLRDRAVNALWVNQSNPQHVLAATEFDGIHQSTDGGSTWRLVFQARAIDLTADADGSLFAATSRGLVTSVDGGDRWSTVLPGEFVVLASGGGSALLAGDSNGNIMYRRSPAASWTTVQRLPSTLLYDLAIDQQTGEDLYVAAQRQNDVGSTLFVSNDRGTTWREELIAPQCPQGLAVSRAERQMVFACNGSMYRSIDRGRTRQPLANAVFDNQSVYLPSVAGADQIIAASDHGIWRSTDLGATWTNLTESLPVAIVNSLAVRGTTIVTAVQDFSAQISFDNGRTWTSFDAGDQSKPSGEVGMALINPVDPAYCYVVTTSGYHHSSDGCRTWRRQTERQFSNKPWTPGGVGTNVIAVDLTRPHVVYTFSSFEGDGTSAVFKSVDWGANFAPTGWPVGTPAAIAVAPSDSNRIVVTSIEPDRTTVISVTSDGGRTWKQHRPDRAFEFGAAIAIDPNNRDVIVVGSSNVPAAGGGVLRSLDGGNTWAKANTGMSTERRYNRYGIATTALRFNSQSVLAMATTNGAYVSWDLGVTWHDVTGNSISRYFTDVAWEGAFLYSSSFGSGVQRSPVSFSLPVLK